MAIRASSSKEISTLVDDLCAPGATTREAAVARLTVIGARAVERLVALAQAPGAAPPRVAALRTLEGIADPRALRAALDALDDADDTVATAGAALARVFVRGVKGAAAVDRLTSVALDKARPAAVRMAALRGLRDLQPSTLAPVLTSLASDPDAAIRSEAAAAAGHEDAARPEPLDVLTRAAGERLPADAGSLRQAIVQAGQRAELPTLLRVIERIRDHERDAPVADRAEWTAVRAAAHLALAQRGSRLAVYDLRESIEAAQSPLPVEFLAALAIIGDASCVEAIATAHAGARDEWWREHLADAFRAIVLREKLTRRHATIKKVERKRKGALDALWPAR